MLVLHRDEQVELFGGDFIAYGIHIQIKVELEISILLWFFRMGSRGLQRVQQWDQADKSELFVEHVDGVAVASDCVVVLEDTGEWRHVVVEDCDLQVHGVRRVGEFFEDAVGVCVPGEFGPLDGVGRADLDEVADWTLFAVIAAGARDGWHWHAAGRRVCTVRYVGFQGESIKVSFSCVLWCCLIFGAI